MTDIFGQALFDHYEQNGKHKLWINNKYGPKEEMPVDVYFRDEEDMPELELHALANCIGNVLDIGAGVGSHALALQKRGLSVTAMDISPMAATIMRQRGVEDVLVSDIFDFNGKQYDTLLLMMNGIGLCGTLKKLRAFLQHASQLLKPGGQLIFDSSDISYLYNGHPPLTGDYYGELWYQYQYKGKKGDWFKWLYIDKDTLQDIAVSEGWSCQVLFEDDMDQYLIKLNYL
ncbi:SAM-dependent methyltransferase [Mucilaginibacter sp. MD40]|uniref:class I SAM-dependent methyltransferase n=1 Tax=Mucilaginibacter sp. MD40 TaxID=2029590 RepID=UPI000BAC7754|nr:SAM-dependent methyltransferase [Mucilaginibacter sp. MD40]